MLICQKKYLGVLDARSMQRLNRTKQQKSLSPVCTLFIYKPNSDYEIIITNLKTVFHFSFVILVRHIFC